MTGMDTVPRAGGIITASWERCEQKHGLRRNTSQPIMRLQSSEIAPRLEEMTERTGGRRGIFSQLGDIGASAGHCLVVTDTDGVVVRLEGGTISAGEVDWNGIVVGSCWDEKIAGTNGVAMAICQGEAFTVRGKEHYYSKLTPFACTAAPLLDAENNTIGAASFSIVDRGNPADYLLAKQLLGTAVDKIQRLLFENKFGAHLIVSLSHPNRNDLLRKKELVAVDEAGIILSSTAQAHRLIGLQSNSELKGQRFDTVFGTDAAALGNVPERVVSVQSKDRPMLSLSLREDRKKLVPGWRPQKALPPAKQTRRRMTLPFQDLACGSEAMEDLCARAETYCRRSVPFVIEGESGTGKSALVSILIETSGLAEQQVVIVDCGLLDDTPDSEHYLRTLFDQARIASVLGRDPEHLQMLVFDNVDELPRFAQSGLRNLLDGLEKERGPLGDAHSRGIQVIAINRDRLHEAVTQGQFRDDLYYLLTGTKLTLPPVRSRENLDKLARSVARQLAGAGVEITDEAMDAIVAYDWPGNIREMRNVLQQALMEGDGARISLIDLRATNLLTPHTPPADVEDEKAVYRPHLVYDEKSMLLDALIGAHWNISRAARNLSISRATIHRKMKRYGVARPY